MIDTMPVYVLNLTDLMLRKCLYNPKYGGTIYKVQVAIDFLGRIIFIGGPHLRTLYDRYLWTRSMYLHPTLLHEFLLGDGHYIGIANIVSPYKQPVGGHLSHDEYMYNAVHSFYHAQVKHMNAKLKRHAIFRTSFRGSLHVLNSILAVVTQVQAVYQSMYPSYPPYGWWSHF